jgi:hypothetical protein
MRFLRSAASARAAAVFHSGNRPEPTLAPAARPIVQNEGPRARGSHPAAEAVHVLIVKNPVSDWRAPRALHKAVRELLIHSQCVPVSALCLSKSPHSVTTYVRSCPPDVKSCPF